MALNDGIDIARRGTHIESQSERGAAVDCKINGYMCVSRFRIEKFESLENITFIEQHYWLT